MPVTTGAFQDLVQLSLDTLYHRHGLEALKQQRVFVWLFVDEQQIGPHVAFTVT